MSPWETTEDFHRSGHRNPDYFDKDSLRTIDIDKSRGIKAITGCKSGEFENGRCKIGVEVQSFLLPTDEFTLKEAKAWFKEHEGAKKEEEEMDEKLSWVQEIERAFRAMDDEERYRITGQIEASNWRASFNYNAGTMMAELLPDFKTPNVNGFYLHPSLKEKLIAKLNSGTVFLRDAHSRAIKDIIGIVKRGIESRDGKIHIEADVENPEVDKVLKKYKDKMGVSLGGSGVGYCSECNKRVMGMSRCPNHPKASIVVKEFDLKEVSLTEEPAWSTSKVEDYSSG